MCRSAGSYQVDELKRVQIEPPAAWTCLTLRISITHRSNPMTFFKPHFCFDEVAQKMAGYFLVSLVPRFHPLGWEPLPIPDWSEVPEPDWLVWSSGTGAGLGWG